MLYSELKIKRLYFFDFIYSIGFYYDYALVHLSFQLICIEDQLNDYTVLLLCNQKSATYEYLNIVCF